MEEPGGLQSMGCKEWDMTECVQTHTHIHTHTAYGLGAYVSQPNPETEGPRWADLTIV